MQIILLLENNTWTTWKQRCNGEVWDHSFLMIWNRIGRGRGSNKSTYTENDAKFWLQLVCAKFVKIFSVCTSCIMIIAHVPSWSDFSMVDNLFQSLDISWKPHFIPICEIECLSLCWIIVVQRYPIWTS